MEVGSYRPKGFSTQRGVDDWVRLCRPQVVQRPGEKAVDIVERRRLSPAETCWKLREAARAVDSSTLTQAKTPSERNLARRLRLSSSAGTGSSSSSDSRIAWPNRR